MFNRPLFDADSGVAAGVQPLPKRSEVPAEMTWDLSSVYASDAEWENDFSQLEKMLEPFSSLQSTLKSGAGQLLRTLQARDEAGKQFGRLSSYAHLRQSEDNANSESQARADRVEMLGTRFSAAIAWIEPEILSLPTEQIETYLQQESGLELYRYYLKTLEARRPHVRSAEVEDVLAQSAEAMSGTVNVFTMFNNADLKFPKIRDENGQEVELTKGRYINFLESRDRRVREESFKTMHGAYHNWRNTLASSLTGIVKSHVATSRIRGYESALHASLSPEEIPVSVYHNLLSTVRERLPVLHRYLRLRKKLLGLDELHPWDLYVPMLPDADKTMTYDEAQQVVIDSSQPLGEGYGQALRHGFANRWVDVPENLGKTSGAFSDGSYTTPPYILMNWQDRLDSTFTLAHEFGHSLHSYFTRQTQPYVYSGYTIFVAEVASTLSENLLTHYLVERAKAEGDRALQLSLLNQYAERFRTTLFRQTMFAEFELQTHDIVEKNEALTADGMSEIYLQLNRDFYGAEVTMDADVAIEWARIPHFYYDFYVYQYATGVSAAAALSQQILGEGEAAVERYLHFLRGGSSQNSIDLLRGAGVDMQTSQPIHQALDVFDGIVAQMEELSA